MGPSDASKELRRIAAGIDGSESPRTDLVARDLGRVAEAVGAVPLHVVLMGEPAGLAVGFTPSDEALEPFGAELESMWTLVSDDGSDDAAPILSDWQENDIILRTESQPLTEEERDAGLSEFGMDMPVWRDEASMLEDLALYG